MTSKVYGRLVFYGVAFVLWVLQALFLIVEYRMSLMVDSQVALFISAGIFVLLFVIKDVIDDISSGSR